MQLTARLYHESESWTINDQTLSRGNMPVDQHAIKLSGANAAPPKRVKREEDVSELMEDLLEQSTGVPAPGGGQFVGPGGQAPPFAPGGIENPYPASAGMPPNPSLELLEVPDVLYAQPSPAAQNIPPGPGYSAAGGFGAAKLPIQQPLPTRIPNPGLPGHGTTPGKFQPGGGPRIPMPNQPTQRTGQVPVPGQTSGQMRPARDPREGFMARIIPMGLEGGPSLPNIPSQGPGFPTPPIVIPPGEPNPPEPEPPNPPTGGSSKPRGLKILPMPEGAEPPVDSPKPPGQWVTLDAGRGQPPAWGFIAAQDPGTDTGLEPTPKKSHSGTPSHTGVPGSYTSTKGQLGAQSGDITEQRGHYVPVDVRFHVQPVDESGNGDVTWAWVPYIGHDYGVKHEAPKPPETPEPKTTK